MINNSDLLGSEDVNTKTDESDSITGTRETAARNAGHQLQTTPVVLQNVAHEEPAASSLKKEQVIRLEDSTSEMLPKHIFTILERLDMKLNTKFDIMMILIYCLAIESGFYPYELKDQSDENFEWIQTFTFSSSLIDKFSNYLQSIINLGDHNYKITFGFSIFDIKITLYGISSGDLLITTFTIDAKQKQEGKSIVLSVPRYIPISLTSARKKNFASCFRNLKELSFKLKEFVFIPIRNTLLYYRNDRLYPHIIGIPMEVRKILFRYLTLKDGIALSSCCWQLRTDYLDYIRVKKPETYSKILKYTNNK